MKQRFLKLCSRYFQMKILTVLTKKKSNRYPIIIFFFHSDYNSYGLKDGAGGGKGYN